MPPKTKPADKPGDPLAAVLAAVRTAHGKESVMLLGETPMEPIEVIPTGSYALDEALGVGGLPRGRIIELYGPESAGKSSIALHAVANAQKQGLIAAFIDAEHAFRPEWAEKLGVNTDRLIVSQPDNGEQGLDVAETLVTTKSVGIIVIDSVAALVPKAEIAGEMGDSHMGLQARLMSQALRKLTGIASTTGTTIVFINQLREKVGVVFGSSETTTGGKALKFYASVRLDVRKIELLKENGVAVGNKLRIKTVKNKVAPPFREAIVEFYYDGPHVGFSAVAELIDLAVTRGVITKSGSHHLYAGAKIANGKDATRKALEDDPAMLALIEKDVKASIGTVVHTAPVTSLGLSDTPDPWAPDTTPG